jgi:hypothetical protein
MGTDEKCTTASHKGKHPSLRQHFLPAAFQYYKAIDNRNAKRSLSFRSIYREIDGMRDQRQEGSGVWQAFGEDEESYERWRVSQRVTIECRSEDVGYVDWMIEAEFEIQILHLQPSAAAPREPCPTTKE